jgi:hypothetical protein
MLARPQWPRDAFEQWWAAYPRRVAKKHAFKCFERLRKSDELPFEVLMSATAYFARTCVGREMKYIPHPATWLNAGRYDDDPEALLGNSRVVAVASVDPPMVIIRRFSPQADAWERHRRRLGQPPIPWGRSSEWTVQTEWPPR